MLEPNIRSDSAKFFLGGVVIQPMVNCWFGLVVWDSRGTPK